MDEETTQKMFQTNKNIKQFQSNKLVMPYLLKKNKHKKNFSIETNTNSNTSIEAANRVDQQ